MVWNFTGKKINQWVLVRNLVILSFLIASCSFPTKSVERPGNESYLNDVTEPPTSTEEAAAQTLEPVTPTELQPDTPTSTHTESTSTATWTLTPSPTIVLTPTQTQLAFEFVELAFFGGIPFELTNCRFGPDANIDATPALVFYGPTNGIKNGEVWLCVLDLPIGTTFDLRLFNPGGNEVDKLSLRVEPTEDGFNDVIVPLNFTLDIARGKWHALLDDINFHSNAPVDIKQKEVTFLFRPGNDPLLSIHRQFSKRVPSPAAPERIRTLAAGENVVLRGDKFIINSQVPVGIYHQVSASLVPLHTSILSMDDKGRFEYRFQLSPDLEAGWYRAIAFINLDQKDDWRQQVVMSFFVRK
jgi:hypothetical protein